MRTDARIQADALDNSLRVEALHLCVGIELVEVRYTQRQVGIGEQLDRLGLGGAHEEHGNVLLDGPLLDERGELMRGILQRGIVTAHDDAARVEVVVERLALAEELRREEDARHHDLHLAVGLPLAVREFLARMGSIAHRHGGFDDHHGVGIDLQHQFDHLLYVRSVEEILLGVVVRGGGNHHEVRVFVRGTPVQGCHELQRLFREILFDVFVLDGRNPVIDLFNLFRDDVHCHHVVALCEQGRNAETDITRSGYCNFHNVFGVKMCKNAGWSGRASRLPLTCGGRRARGKD